MKDIFSDLLIRVASQYAKFSPNARLSEAIRSTERALSYGRDETDAVARIADRKIVCMDVGARGGMLDYLRVRFESHAVRAMRRTRSMTEAA